MFTTSISTLFIVSVLVSCCDGFKFVDKHRVRGEESENELEYKPHKEFSLLLDTKNTFWAGLLMEYLFYAIV